MRRRVLTSLLGTMLAAGAFLGGGGKATAEDPPLPRMYYYPYYYFPHSYWPSQSPQWPEPWPGHPYVRPPAYMAYPPFLEPNWRYELWQPQKYYRGSHFWLDVF